MTSAFEAVAKNDDVQALMALKARAKAQLPAAKTSPSSTESANQGTGPR